MANKIKISDCQSDASKRNVAQQVDKLDKIAFNTTGGHFNTKRYVLLEDFRLLMLNQNQSVNKVPCLVFDNNIIKYNTILGHDFLNSSRGGVKRSTLAYE